MTLTLHNTLTRRKEPFQPLDPASVRMYVCGPTVYDFAHIGNARPVVVFDLLYRLLKRRYRRVIYARNITDVDDKIIAAARENSEPIEALTARTADAFHADMAALGALPPDIEPRATQHIPQMIALIERLIASGHAYAAEGHVLFDVPSDPEYGKLSGRDREEMIAGARVEVAPYKRDPADFVLWKPSDADQPGWDSPWGRGRPGWHIECSAMSEVHLGESFDIHGGGLDLVFPHHENEIAQSECAHNKPFARFWLHNGYVVVNGEKMSKSLGNFLTVRQLLEEGIAGETLRLVLLSAHYRQPLDFTRSAVEQAKARLDRWYRALASAALAPVPTRAHEPDADLTAALEDDLNTPRAIAALDELATELLAESDRVERAELAAELKASGALMGLLGSEPEAWFKGGAHETGGLGAAEIERRIAARNDARKAKNFPEADRIRRELEAAGVLLEDGAQGTSWRRKG
ncbi:MAG TPA: cysteine--tRNA ligase [Alphaproteobacteria bacterium]|nr:cysteine--tRNA ligase [Alphaproteobacteria bacterium]